MEDESGYELKDYKIFCFAGKAEYVLVCSGRTENLKLDFYDLDWNYVA